MYSIGNNPLQTNIRHYGQNPDIPSSVREINKYTVNIREDSPISNVAFDKGSVQGFPSVLKPQVFTYDAVSLIYLLNLYEKVIEIYIYKI